MALLIVSVISCMDASEKAVVSADASAADDTSQTCVEQTHGCSHYQRKCLLVVWTVTFRIFFAAVVCCTETHYFVRILCKKLRLKYGFVCQKMSLFSFSFLSILQENWQLSVWKKVIFALLIVMLLCAVINLASVYHSYCRLINVFWTCDTFAVWRIFFTLIWLKDT